ncbi:alpha-(1,6)-fucosyltransferase-like isoform X3 [Schistocerca gregaria]|uniref:alpha-(1,6)-fucosyltransferase-like isoform X3 n=1 Tax=Schistocerca gregaria TaxID=7010 RepID=UPI00211F00AE|nr:alpha-(1,6)-fucosyltransferase-like isoform X3 [Schistocerca gregaria]
MAAGAAAMKLSRLGVCGRALVALLLGWLLVLLLVAVPALRAPPSAPAAPAGLAAVGGGPSALLGGGGGGAASADERRLQDRLRRAFADLDVLKRQHLELRDILASVNMGKDMSLRPEEREAVLRDLQEKLRRAESLLDGPAATQPQPAPFDDKYSDIEQHDEPEQRYEVARRRVAQGSQEMWYYVSAELRHLQKQLAEMGNALGGERQQQLADHVGHVLDMAHEHHRSLQSDIDELARVDGYEAWREREAAELSDLVQRRLHSLQNPQDCNTARKLVCALNKGCGYGCQLHHVVYCLLVAYGTQRTMILKSKGWRYHKGGWEEVFLPVSETCTDAGGSSRSHWPGKSHTQVVELPIVDSLSPRPPYLPLAIPRDLAPRLARLHGDPPVWWVGQFLKFLLRPQEGTARMLHEAADRLSFVKPIVGVHVRRTDKVGTEAAFHHIDEYMGYVEDYYLKLELKQGKTVERRVYLASDDPKVIGEARSKYPQYEILGDPSIARTAAVATRYSDSSLNGIIIDIHFLSLCDYLVCTFSSQVCRVAYELMQTLHADASDRFKSLDDIYYYGGQNQHTQVAVIPHKPRAGSRGELELRPGDAVSVAGNHWDGWSKGRSIRTGQIGLYPSFKVKEKLDVVDFPTYPEVPLRRQRLLS